MKCSLLRVGERRGLPPESQGGGAPGGQGPQQEGGVEESCGDVTLA